jgi:hypothetical protein
MIGAVYQSDARRSISKRPGRRQPSKSSADNNNLDLSHRLPPGSLGDCDLRCSGESVGRFAKNAVIAFRLRVRRRAIENIFRSCRSTCCKCASVAGLRGSKQQCIFLRNQTIVSLLPVGIS